jgi:hypothetical protein
MGFNSAFKGLRVYNIYSTKYSGEDVCVRDKKFTE